VRAVSVLRFQAITTVVPRVLGGVGGTSRTGRPLEQRHLNRGRARLIGLIARSPEHGDVESPGIVADEVVLRQIAAAPAEAKT
jgi:hypothetical protein